MTDEVSGRDINRCDKTADEFIGRGSTVLAKFAGGRPVEPNAAGPGVQLLVDPGR